MQRYHVLPLKGISQWVPRLNETGNAHMNSLTVGADVIQSEKAIIDYPEPPPADEKELFINSSSLQAKKTGWNIISTPSGTIMLPGGKTAPLYIRQAICQGLLPSDLILQPEGGKVGIGTTNPAGNLDVFGDAYVGTGNDNENHKLVIRGPNAPGSSSSYQDLSYEFRAAGSVKIRAFRGGSWDTYLQFLTNNAENDDPQVRMHIDGRGNVGIGTTNPVGKLNVDNGDIFIGKDAEGTTSLRVGISAQSGGHTFLQAVKSCGSEWGVIALNPNAGNVGIGTANPSAKLEVNGDIKVTGDVVLVGADCAEDFDISEAKTVDEGTVMVIDETGKLEASQVAYDKRVAGVISGAGKYKTGIILDKQPSSGSRMAIALVGKVYCKVDAQYGQIEVGDLLTTSPTLGHAMRASEPAKAFGSVIGKALKPLDKGRDLIPILVALQ